MEASSRGRKAAASAIEARNPPPHASSRAQQPAAHSARPARRPAAAPILPSAPLPPQVLSQLATVRDDVACDALLQFGQARLISGPAPPVRRRRGVPPCSARPRAPQLSLRSPSSAHPAARPALSLSFSRHHQPPVSVSAVPVRRRTSAALATRAASWPPSFAGSTPTAQRRAAARSPEKAVIRSPGPRRWSHTEGVTPRVAPSCSWPWRVSVRTTGCPRTSWTRR